VGFYEDGTPGEIFIKMAKEGSTISGLMDTIATLTSMALQYGVPLQVLVDKFSHVRFEPSGFTKNPEVPLAKSLTDYIFRFLGIRFLSDKHQEGETGEPSSPSQTVEQAALETAGPVAAGFALQATSTIQPQADAPSCPECGALMIRNGSCYKCLNCGATSGCS
jgi:ribonucleoside-diphosphate reductase alpha chain